MDGASHSRRLGRASGPETSANYRVHRRSKREVELLTSSSLWRLHQNFKNISRRNNSPSPRRNPLQMPQMHLELLKLINQRQQTQLQLQVSLELARNMRRRRILQCMELKPQSRFASLHISQNLRDQSRIWRLLCVLHGRQNNLGFQERTHKRGFHVQKTDDAPSRRVADSGILTLRRLPRELSARPAAAYRSGSR